ncbi:Ubiquinone/menaquinone biosynthesis C-methyltransferase UbiE [Neomoorella glycerini]|uniref:Ubiquinone/menaquinone biosynthesis C-methyltransferase UbiE n=1 Tax=Neomoorella glycerini TaxID=55779 RepID=A0A6I5ZVN0_9FIRM|nr:class I SAM-dependent methyltransferase [Moorella glycerini]QGP93856.1 Ubiquinone/menaquinone biosynthesis C-methyltransferase UbiE [Moorella glycerini]
MNNLRQAMRERWNTKGYHYDHRGNHGTKSPAEKERWTKILEQLGPGPLAVLDVGTGTGFVALLLAEIGHRVTGIDWSTTMLDQARMKAREAGLEIAFIEAETESLPFAAACFDAVVARHVLWTLTDPRQTLTEWYRVLKPHGRVLADFSPRRSGTAGHHYPLEIEKKLPLNKALHPAEVVALFEDAGFTNVQAEALPLHPDSNAVTYLISGFKRGGCGHGSA